MVRSGERGRGPVASILELAGVALAALLSENFVLVSCMGIGTRTEAFRDPMDAVRTGYCLTAVMVLGALCAWLIDFFLLGRFGWQHYRLLVLALLIPGLVAGLRKFLKVCIPELSRRIDGQLKSVATNCAALGSALLISQRSYSLPAALIFALCGGIGATVALASFAGLQNEVDLESCPRSFRGIPIQLITAGLMAMALVGYYGLHVHEAVLEKGVKVTGATVHYVDEGMDTGEIIAQKPVMVEEGDTPEILQKRVMEQAEWKLLPAAINMIANQK